MMRTLHHWRPTRRRLGRPVDRFVRGLSTAPNAASLPSRCIAAECVESPPIVDAMLTRHGTQRNHGVIAVQSP